MSIWENVVVKTYLILFSLMLIGLINLQAEEQPKKVMKPYPIGDLVNTPLNGSLDERVKSLIRSITSTIEPKSWEDQGGTATIEYYPLAAAILVNQTKEIHDEIEKFIEDRRKEQMESEKSEDSPKKEK
ncbi:MAG: hypothetical protein N2112_03740 [Gemmataceae bacterium]|jgi:hypothetical protein|nr:hypothetical protein [Gemmataceae bacterium]